MQVTYSGLRSEDGHQACSASQNTAIPTLNMWQIIWILDDLYFVFGQGMFIFYVDMLCFGYLSSTLEVCLICMAIPCTE
ncbi:hypothetical protein O6P43_021653 [Quillaja saponaria]|uniref:Uncharacterized protein n=1 Tax=Quillaja saponaria TaxID=32244 RepID=A0AAD7LCX3_QUISA|nr:hypothetical protein O6P43_021653 [Quillaja saponaria]